MCKAVKLTEDPISGKKLHFYRGRKYLSTKIETFFFSTVAAVSYVYFQKELNFLYKITHKCPFLTNFNINRRFNGRFLKETKMV